MSSFLYPPRLRALDSGIPHACCGVLQDPRYTVVIGGVITSTLLTLIVLPTVYEMIERRAARRAD